MTDQFRVGNNVQASQAQNNVQNVQDIQNDAPHEIAHARPSKLSVALRIIAGIFTLGISEGIRFIAHKIRSAEPRGNQVQPQNPDMIPAANPGVDQSNRALAEKIIKNNIPENIKTALNEVAQEYRNKFGNRAVPENVNTLLNELGKNNRPMVIQLRYAVQDAHEEITPENIKPLFENILKEHVEFLAIKSALAEECDNTSIPLGPQALQSLAREFIGKKAAQQNIDTLDDAKNFITSVPEKNEIIKKHQLNFIASAENLKGNKIFPEDNLVVKTAKKVINDLNANFNGFLKSDKIEDLLLFSSISENRSIHTELSETIKNAQNVNAVTQERLETEIYSILNTDLKNYALNNILKNKFEEAEIPVLSDTVTTSYIDVLRKSITDFDAEVKTAKSTNELTAIVNKYSNLIDTKLNEIKANIHEIENRYLGEVNEEVKPVLKKMIHSVLFDNGNKQKSELFVQEQVQYMKHWKNFEASKSFPGFDRILNTVKKDLSYLEGTHADDEFMNIYQDNIYSTFVADANRYKYVINGEELPRKTDVVLNTVKNTFTNPVDQQFISKLANQRLFANVSLVQNFNVVNGQQIGMDGQPYKYQGTELYHNNMGNVIAQDNPQDSTLKKDTESVFYINVDNEKKTGSVVFTGKSYLTTRTPPLTSYGAVEFTLKCNFTLSEGNEIGLPTIDSMEISQKFGNPY